MAWRPRTPHEHSAGNGSTSPHPTAKVPAKRLWPLALLLLALLALLLSEDGERESEPQPVRLSPATVTVEDIDASFKADQLTVTFNIVLSQAAASTETLRYRIEAGDGKSSAHPLPAEGTVTFARGEIRKSVQLSFQAAARSPRSIVLFGQSPGLSIGGDGRYNILLADAVPARKVRKKPAPRTAVKTEPSRFAAKSESPLTPPPVPAEQPSTPDEAGEGGAAIPPMPILDERHAGLAFVKLDADGKPLADQSADYATTPWSCVLDNTTALVWEIKRDDGGLHDRDWTYTWYDTRAGNGGNAGTAGKGFCGDTLASGCDTEKFAQAVNGAGLCGANDWRLPTQEELQSIVALDRTAPSVDRALFPNTQPSWYWSSSPVASDAQHVWMIGFYHGYDVWGRKSHDFYVRLVRRATNTSSEPAGRANQ